MDFISYFIIAIGIGLAAWVTVKQKPWWKLTEEEKKKRMPIMIAGLVLVVLGIVLMIWQLSARESKIIGGEKDEHGCLIAAGYSWCEPKNKCLRIWEEACYVSVEQEIQYILAGKYSRLADEVEATVLKQDGNFASGSVLFGQGGPGEGGMFLAAKTGNIWQVVFDGNGSVDCEKMRQEYKFPEEILVPDFCD
jgi:hypothetical protein